MNRAENDAYWGSTDTNSSALDNFFDEDSEVGWSSYPSNFNAHSKNATAASSTTASRNDQNSASIVDNIISSSSAHSLSEGITGDLDHVSISGGKLTKNVGRAIGEKLDSWKPPSVSIKWNTQGAGSDVCMHCEGKNEEIQQLKKRLESSYSRYSFTLPPDDMVNRILLGQPYSLESYHSLEDKLALIDTALGTMDSSSILVTVLHLKNTVKKSIFLKEMQTRLHAAQVYVHYLKQRYNFTEAIDFLGSLGKHEEAAILTYKWTLSGKSSNVKLKNMTKSLQSHFNDPALTFESSIVKEHAKLLEQQVLIEEKDSADQNQMLVEYPPETSIIDSSLLATFFYCSKYHWDASESHIASPVALRKSHTISDRQVLWTVLRGRAQVNHWPLPSDLDSWMGSKGIIGALSSLKSALGGVGRIVKATLPVDQVVHMLHSADAPPNVLAAYITLVDSLDTRLKLAVNCKSHQAVIDVYVAQKDRDALEKYMKEIPVGSPEYVKAENALKTVRWKN